MAFTCGKCETKQARTFSKDSYDKGVVMLRCGGCDSLHLVADNLGWFRDGKTNIEDIMREKGEKVIRHTDDNSVEFNLKPETFVNTEGLIAEFKAPEPKFKNSSRKVQGNQDAAHTIKIEYCGG